MFPMILGALLHIFAVACPWAWAITNVAEVFSQHDQSTGYFFLGAYCMFCAIIFFFVQEELLTNKQYFKLIYVEKRCCNSTKFVVNFGWYFFAAGTPAASAVSRWVTQLQLSHAGHAAAAASRWVTQLQPYHGEPRSLSRLVAAARPLLRSQTAQKPNCPSSSSSSGSSSAAS